MSDDDDSFLNGLLPIRKILVDGVAQPFVRDLEFPSSVFTVATDLVKGIATITLLASAFVLSGDVTGPANASVVTKLTGTAGVVNTPNASWKLTSLLAGVGEMVNANATNLIFGNLAANPATQLQGGSITIRSSNGIINLLSNAANSIYYDADKHRFRSVGGTEAFQFDGTNVAVLIDSASGTFPASGFFRFKSYGSDTTLISVRNGGGDSPLLIHNGATYRITLGNVSGTVGTDLIVQASFGFTLQSSGSAMNFYCAGAGYQFSNYSTGNDNFTIPSVGLGSGALLLFGQNVIATFGQKQALTNVNGTTFTIAGQAAKAGGAGNGGTLALASGAKDGAGTDGTVTISTGATQQLSVAATGTWTFAGGTIFTASTTLQLTATNAARLGTTTRGVLADHVTGAVNVLGASGEYLSVGSAGQDLLRMKWTDSGAGSFEFDAGKTSITIKQNDKTANGGTGATLLIQAQNETGTTSDGGVLQLLGGTGTTADGRVFVGMSFDHGWIQYTFPADANQTWNAIQSANNFINILAGVITAGRTITIRRRLAAPGQIFVRNNTAQTITIQWLTGGGVTLATNTSAIIGSDGTNAVKLMTGT